MIIVQAENNSPIVSALKQGKTRIIPFRNFHTIAHAITSGAPYGGNEIIQKARHYNWLAESASEDEIIHSQRILKESGYFVEPASATVLPAVKKLRFKWKDGANDNVVLVLTGSEKKKISIVKKNNSLHQKLPSGCSSRTVEE